MLNSDDSVRVFKIGSGPKEVFDATIDASAVAAAWRVDRRAFKRHLTEAAQLYSRVAIIQGVTAAIHELRDASFRRTLTKCAWQRRTISDCRTIILTEIIRSGDARIVEEFVHVFRGIMDGLRVRRWAKPKLVDFEDHVLRVCRWRVSELAAELDELRSINAERGRGRQLYCPSTAAQLEAALLWFNRGYEAILPIACDVAAPADLRMACIFLLGCEQIPVLASTIEAIYWGPHEEAVGNTRVACIEALARCAPMAFLDGFLQKVLKRHSRGLDERGFDSHEVCAVFKAFYIVATISDELRQLAVPWTNAVSDRNSACALVALESHGFVDMARARELHDRFYYAYRAMRHVYRSKLLPAPQRQHVAELAPVAVTARVR